MSRAAPEYPRSSATSIAHFSPMSRAVEYLFLESVIRTKIFYEPKYSRVAADVVGAHAEVSNLQALNIVYVEALVQHTMLDDAVALLGRDGASLLWFLSASCIYYDLLKGTGCLHPGSARYFRRGASPTPQ